MGGSPSVLASKNISPPLQAKIRNRQKFLAKRGDKCNFFEKSLRFWCFKSEELTNILFLKTSIFFLLLSQKYLFYPCRNLA